MKQQIIYRLFVSMLIMVSLSGCYVTEVQDSSGENVKYDKNKAVDDYVALAREYINLGQTKNAQAPLKRALEINKSSDKANATLAYMYQKDQEPALAEEYYKKALSYNDKFTAGRNDYGMFLYSQGRYPEALTQLKIAAEDTMFSGRSRVFYNLGLVNLKLNQTADAEVAFSKSVVLDGTNADAQLMLAQINLNKRALPQAATAYDAYVNVVKDKQSAAGLWVGIQLSRSFDNKAAEIKYGEMLKQQYPTSEEYLLFKNSVGKK